MNLKKAHKLLLNQKHSGQEMVEWWFIVSVVAFVVMFSLIRWGEETNTMMNNLMQGLNSVETNINTTT